MGARRKHMRRGRKTAKGTPFRRVMFGQQTVRSGYELTAEAYREGHFVKKAYPKYALRIRAYHATKGWRVYTPDQVERLYARHGITV